MKRTIIRGEPPLTKTFDGVRYSYMRGLYADESRRDILDRYRGTPYTIRFAVYGGKTHFFSRYVKNTKKTRQNTRTPKRKVNEIDRMLGGVFKF